MFCSHIHNNLAIPKRLPVIPLAGEWNQVSWVCFRLDKAPVSRYSSSAGSTYRNQMVNYMIINSLVFIN
jgi:hypothetical protein